MCCHVLSLDSHGSLLKGMLVRKVRSLFTVPKLFFLQNESLEGRRLPLLTRGSAECQSDTERLSCFGIAQNERGRPGQQPQKRLPAALFLLSNARPLYRSRSLAFASVRPAQPSQTLKTARLYSVDFRPEPAAEAPVKFIVVSAAAKI